jgi:hypothetical protein
MHLNMPGGVQQLQQAASTGDKRLQAGVYSQVGRRIRGRAFGLKPWRQDWFKVWPVMPWTAVLRR